MEFIREQLAHVTALQAKTAEQLARTDRRLNRAIRLAVRDARQERKRREELRWGVDEKITQLAAAQLITEEKLQRFIDECRSTNGKKLRRPVRLSDLCSSRRCYNKDYPPGKQKT